MWNRFIRVKGEKLGDCWLENWRFFFGQFFSDFFISEKNQKFWDLKTYKILFKSIKNWFFINPKSLKTNWLDFMSKSVDF